VVPAALPRFSAIKAPGMAAAKAQKQKTKGAPIIKEKVKRSPSAYILFSADTRANIKATNPTATFGETGKLLGEARAKLSEEQKKVSCYSIQLQ